MAAASSISERSGQYIRTWEARRRGLSIDRGKNGVGNEHYLARLRSVTKNGNSFFLAAVERKRLQNNSGGQEE
jgi:hypothetical protein